MILEILKWLLMMSLKCSSHLNMNFKERMELKRLRSFYNLEVIQEEHFNNEVIYQDDFKTSKLLQYRSLNSKKCLDIEFVPTPPKSSPKFAPSPRRKFLKEKMN